MASESPARGVLVVTLADGRTSRMLATCAGSWTSET